MEKVYVIEPCRTAVGAFQGSLKDVPAVELGAMAIREVLRRSGVDPAAVDQVILGNVLQAGLGQNPARQAAIKGGIPAETVAFTMNKVCGSGLVAVSLAAALIRAGEADCILAGGMESMSGSPYVSFAMRTGARMGDKTIEDVMIKDGLTDAFNQYHMGITAENVAERYAITREEQDEFAFGSQKKASEARAAGRFKEEIFPVMIPQRKGDPVAFDSDEFIRDDADPAKMAKLKPSFKKDGTVTAANASGINDGAAVMLVASESFVKTHGLVPFARHVAGASSGVDPAVMGLGPIPSSKKALEKAGLVMADIDLVEANEAFAAQAIAVGRDLEIPAEKLNVNGGAIAIGHPIGASGARITVTLLHEMKRRGAKYGLSTLCIGGGMGEAAVFERDELCQ